MSLIALPNHRAAFAGVQRHNSCSRHGRFPPFQAKKKEQPLRLLRSVGIGFCWLFRRRFQLGGALQIYEAGRVPFFNLRGSAFAEPQRDHRFMPLAVFLFHASLFVIAERRFQPGFLCIDAHLVNVS